MSRISSGQPWGTYMRTVLLRALLMETGVGGSLTKGTGKLIVFDFLFFAVLPYIVWTWVRHLVSDYHALLLSTVPCFIYSAGRFVLKRTWDVTGIFLVATLLIGTAADLLSGNAENMIQNHIRVLLAFSLLFVASMLAKRPLALYFYADTVKLLGWMPEDHRHPDNLRKRELLPYFQGLTLLFALRYVVLGLANFQMFSLYGVEGYGLLLWWRAGISWGFGALILLASLYVAGRVKERMSVHYFVSSK